MKISNASLDCWLWAGILRPDYSDYQHHHWDLSPSPNIDHTINYSNYIWTLDSNGRDTIRPMGRESWLSTVEI